jgi:hypothetical protein
MAQTTYGMSHHYEGTSATVPVRAPPRLLSPTAHTDALFYNRPPPPERYQRRCTYVLGSNVDDELVA